MLNYLKYLPRKVHYDAITSIIRLDGRTDLYSLCLVFYQIVIMKLWQTKKVLPAK